MKLSVIIVNYNVRPYIDLCIDAAKRAIEGVDAEIFVVDNHSSDDSVEFLKAHHPDVHVFASRHNLGFSRANNLAIRKTTSDYVLLLNPDTIVGENVVKDSLAYLDEHRDVGCVGVNMLNIDGDNAPESRRGEPTPLVAFYKVTGLCNRFPKSKRFAKYYMGDLPWDKPGEIDVCSGAYMMIRRETLNQVGCLDEDFFMYGEDIDLSYRIKHGGWKNVYLPSKMLHYKGESTHKSSFSYVHVFYQAMLIYFSKHYAASARLLSFPIRVAIYAKAVVALIGIQIYSMRKALGLLRKKHRETFYYVFVGHKQNAEHFSAIADTFGLDCEVRETLDDTIADACVVFDSSFFSYSEMLDYMSRHKAKNIIIGVYYEPRRMLITPYDIYEI